ncbi:nuclease-related domain-containing DEAD/DEAH box helicase [Xylanimonas ulmi]|uniref:PhoH-like protein n=1 Tax=Xylanimonas ulmi TaxID=228973 RepID=A0A4Q7M268_9MICO|nr:NERD domain-containing protein [Xylanibacterium ulmi]RZS60528.1 PhoH-like protein [Xylanibacterium ulmi]
MPHLYPSEPWWRDADAATSAERAVWEALAAQLPDDAALFHGLRLQDGPHEHEIDLLVAWPGFGLAVIEVKGGHVTHDGDGWFQSGRDGVRRRIDPVAQAQDARHALSTLLRGRGLAAGYARAAHLVALPFQAVSPHWDALDLPRAMVVDRGDLERSFGAADRVRAAITRFGAGSAPLDEPGREALAAVASALLRPEADAITAAAEHEVRLEQLTQDQASILDLLRHQRRVRIVGAAGSGKTWLALEQARRRAKAGERVALLCYSRGLGYSFQRVVAGWPVRERPAYVGLFHDLALGWGAPEPPSDDAPAAIRQAYYETDLPEALGALACRRAPSDLFDSVVVDEAQDFGQVWWPALLRCLRDPDHGGLFVFMDDDQALFPRDGRPPIDLPPFVLEENLRSTKQIARTFGALTDTQVQPRGLSGAPVRVVDVPYAGAVGGADDAVDALVGEGWDPGHVALLTTGSRHPEQRNTVEVVGYEAYWADFFAATDAFYGHVLNFKGLERSVVVLAVNGFQNADRARSMLYTGMSRAKSLLVVVGPRAEVERIGGEAVRRRLAKAEVWAPGA